MLYFAYGSNMCTGRLRQRVPSAAAPYLSGYGGQFGYSSKVSYRGKDCDFAALLRPACYANGNSMIRSRQFRAGQTYWQGYPTVYPKNFALVRRGCVAVLRTRDAGSPMRCNVDPFVDQLKRLLHHVPDSRRSGFLSRRTRSAALWANGSPSKARTGSICASLRRSTSRCGWEPRSSSSAASILPKRALALR